MAEDIVFSTSIDRGGEGAKSLKNLKDEFKSLQSELSKTTVGTKAYNDTLVKLGKVKDDIGDLNATINALNPEGKVAAFQNVAGKLASGFQAATGAAALFGVESKELEKTLLKVQAATAFAEGIRGIAGMKDAFMVLGAVIRANPIFTLVSVLAAVSAAVIALTRETSNLKDEIAQENKVINENIKVLDRQLELLEAQGNQEGRIIALKKEKVALQIQEIENSIRLQKENLKEAEQLTFLEKLLYSSGIAAKSVLEDRAKRVSEVNEGIKKSESEIADLKNHLAAEEIKTENKISEEAKRRFEEEKKLREERIKNFQDFLAANQKSQEEYDALIAEEKRRQHEQELLDFEAQLKAQQEIENNIRNEEEDQQNDRIKADLQNFKDTQAEKTQAQKEQEAARTQVVNQGVAASKAISDLFFQYQLNKAKGNAAEELKIRKKQFEVDKAFSITRTIIDGVRSVQAALTLPPPLSYVLAALNGVLAAANVIKIANTKFDGGTVSADTSSPNISSSAPQIQTQAPTIQPTTRLDDNGRNLDRQQPVLRAVVVETDMTDSQSRIRRLESQSSFG